MPAFPDLLEPLTDGQVSLRLASEWDIPDILIAHQDDPQLHVRRGLVRPPSGAELGRAAERAPAELASGTLVELTILLPGSDDCRGRIIVHHVDWENRRAEIGIWVAPALRGHGLGRGALRLAAGWLTGACGIERLDLLTEPDNAPMLHAARAAGFREEGTASAGRGDGGQGADLALLTLRPGDLARG